MRMLLIILSFLIVSCLSTQAQNLTNLSATQQGNEVVVNYQLDGDKGKAYSITLYASSNNFTVPLQLVMGDVASKRVLPGANKTIKWRVLDELRSFDGDISFEIRAVAAIPLFQNIETSSPKVKRGKEVTISWSALTSEPVTVELVHGENSIPIGTGNAGKLTYTVPKKMKTGEYTVALTAAGETLQGGSFAVMPIYPMYLKAAVAAAIIGIIIWSPWDNGTNPGPVKTEPLIGPPDLTGN